MKTPTHYADISKKALEIKEKMNLTDTQTLLYNHICRGDFKLVNSDGAAFYDENNNGFGWSADRTWVKDQLKPLIKQKLVEFESVRDCRDDRYKSWYFWDSKYDLNDLVDAGCYVSTYKLALIKHYLKLEDGFNKKNEKWGDLELIHNKKGYTFKYKGESSIWTWDNDGLGKKEDVFKTPLYYESFVDMIDDIWSFLAHDGYKLLSKIPNYTEERIFQISEE